MMKLTFLGTGSAFGTPSAGGDWGACDKNNKKNNRNCQSVIIELKGKKILVDIGPDFRNQSIQHNIDKFDFLIITHAHYDHFFGLPELPNFVKNKEGIIELHAHHDTWTSIKKSIYWLFDGDCFTSPLNDKLILKNIDYDKSSLFSDTQIDFFKQNHGEINSTGFRINDFAYCTDVNNFPKTSWEKLKDLDTLVLECDHLLPSKQHNNLEQALSWIHDLKPRVTYLTHFHPIMDYDYVSRLLPPNVFMAYDGLNIDI